MPSGWGLSWGGWLDNRRGEWWLLAQLLLIAAHLLPATPPVTSLGLTAWGLTAWPAPLQLTGVVILLAALLLAARSLLSLGSSLSPLPAPRDDNQLIQHGAYSHCRHPLYRAVLLASLGVVIASGSALHLILLLALSAVLRGKARHEEQALAELHPDYRSYMSSTPAIVPHLPGLDWRR